MAETYRTTPHDTDRMPPGIPFIVGNEAAERFSYYGMLSILVVFLSRHLRNLSGEVDPLSDADAATWQHNFQAAVYATPLFGAILSDWLWGKYRTIITLSLFYVAGHAVLALVDIPQVTGIEPRTVVMIALTLIAIGAGGIKPCVSAHVGDQFGAANAELIPQVFGWFYLSINVGAAISTALIPWLLDSYGPAVAFGIPGVLMALALAVFWAGRNEFAHIPPAGRTFWPQIATLETAQVILNLIPLYALTIPFWCLFDQTHTTWVQQAEKMNLSLLGVTLKAAQVQVLNPVLILILVPLINYLVIPWCERFVRVTPLRKIGVGLFLTAPSYVVLALVQRWIDAGQQPTIAWHVLAYVLITAGEVLVSITCLEFSYTQAPRELKSILMGVFFLVGITLGNVLAGRVITMIDGLQAQGDTRFAGENYFWFFAILMLASAATFVVYSQFYRGRTYVQGEE